jgi:hypothetical protein
MDEMERLLRHLEEVAEEIQSLKHRLAFLEDHRIELRQRILAFAPPWPGLSISIPTSCDRHPIARRSSGALALRQTADAVAKLNCEVDAQILSTDLKISYDAARLRLARAARQGLLVRIKLGKYRATNHVGAEHSNGASRG